MRKAFFIGALLLFSMTCLALETPVVFNTQDFPPFSYTIDGRPAGPGVDIVSMICRQAQIPYRIQLLPWDQAQAEVKTGKAQALFFIGKNSERENWLDFSKAVVHTAYGIFVRTANPLQYIQPQDLHNATIGVYGPSNTSYSLEKLASQTTGVTIEMTTADETAFKNLAKGKIDAVYSNREVGWALIYKLGLKNIRFAGVATKLNYYVGFSKKLGDAGIARAFDKAYVKAYASGKIGSILAQYQMETATIEDITPQYGSGDLAGKRIRIVDDAAEWPPYTYYKRIQGKKTSQIVGFSIEVIEKIFEKHHLTSQIELVPWKRALRGVELGTYHMLLNASYSTERAQKYYLSSPYYTTRSYYFYSKKKHPSGLPIHSIRDLKDYDVCGMLGYNYLPYGIEKVDPACNSFQSLIGVLHMGHCDLFLEKFEIVAGFAVIGTDFLADKDLGYAPVPHMQPEAFYMMFTKNELGRDLKTLIDKELADMRASGELDRLLRKYIPLTH